MVVYWPKRAEMGHFSAKPGRRRPGLGLRLAAGLVWAAAA